MLDEAATLHEKAPSWAANVPAVEGVVCFIRGSRDDSTPQKSGSRFFTTRNIITSAADIFHCEV